MKGYPPWPYPQTLDKAVKSCQRQTLYLITNFRKLQMQKVFKNLALGPVLYYFLIVIYEFLQ
jgi:hypothetical protein